MKKRVVVLFCCLIFVLSSISVNAQGEPLLVNGIKDNILIENGKGKIESSVSTIYYNNKNYYSINDVAKAIGYGYIWDRLSDQVSINETTIDTNQEIESLESMYGVDKKIFTFNMSVSAKGAVIVEDDKNNVLFQKNAFKKLYPASTTKILTAILALEHGNLDDLVTVGKAVNDLPGDSRRVFIYPGDQLTLEQLLYGLLLHSGNDCAVAIAEHIGGSVEGFSKMMNDKAKEFGAINSNFMNPHGYHHKNHYTTARDLAAIMLGCVEDETFRKIVNTGSYTTKYKNRNGNMVTKHWKNTNRFTRDPENYYLAGEIGGKTGFTSIAGCCLVNATSYNDHTYVTVMLNDGGNERYYNTKKLIKKAYALRENNDSENLIELSIYEVKPTITLGTRIINVEDYTFVHDSEMYMTYDKINEIFGEGVITRTNKDLKVYFNDKRMTYYRLNPVLYNEQLMLPINELIDDINYNVGWDEVNNKLVLSNGQSIIEVPIETDMISINGRQVEIDNKDLIGNDIYVSVDFIEKVSDDNVNFTTNSIFKINRDLKPIVPMMLIGDRTIGSQEHVAVNGAPIDNQEVNTQIETSEEDNTIKKENESKDDKSEDDDLIKETTDKKDK